MFAAIRPGEPPDAGFFADVWRAMLDELDLAPEGFVPDWRERLTQHFSGGIADESQGWFVAESGGRRIGTAAAFLRNSVPGDVMGRRSAVLAGVYVLPPHRGVGVGRKLVTSAIEWARQRGCTEIRLQASAAAEPLYRSLGFEDDRGFILKLQ
ncbi:MAG: GNAT family N-acetyltransferase [Candidatus Tumulicola sp.]